MKSRLKTLVMIAFLTVAWQVTGTPLGKPGAVQKEDRPPRLDCSGDPLPDRALVRLGTTRLRHGGCITAVAYSPDGKLLASASDSDNQVIVWELPSYKRRYQFTVPGTRESWLLLFSWDGVFLASRSAAGVLQVWEMKSGKEVMRSDDRSLASTPLAFTRDCKMLATVQAEQVGGLVQLLDLTTGKVGRTIEAAGAVRALTFTPEDRLLVVAVENRKAFVTDLTAKKVLHALGPCDGYGSFAIAPDGRTVAIEGGTEGKILVFDTLKGKRLHRLPGPPLFHGNTRSVFSLTFAMDGKSLLAGCNDDTVRLWDLGTGKERTKVNMTPFGLPLAVLAPDGKTMATGGALYPHGVQLWDAVSGKQANPFAGHLSPVSSVVFSPNGKLSATCSWVHNGGEIWLWETETGRPVRSLLGHSGGTFAVAFSPDGNWLASSGWWDHTVRLWDVRTGRLLRTLCGHWRGVTRLAFSPDGKRLASGDACKLGLSRCEVRIWEPASGRLLHEILDLNGSVDDLTFSPDGQTLMVARDGVYFHDVATGRVLGKPLQPGPHRMTLALSLDGRVLATVSSSGVRLWEVASRQPILTLPADFQGHAGVFGPDTRFLAVGAKEGVRFFDWATGKECQAFTGHRGTVVATAFSPDYKVLATASNWESSTLLWNVADVFRRPLPAAAKPSPKDLDRWWEYLGELDDAAVAYRAVWELAKVPEQAVPYSAVLKPPPPPNVKQLDQWIQKLNDNNFKVRQQASLEIEKLGESAEGPLRKALKTKIGLEQRRRIDGLLEKLTAGSVIRQLRQGRCLAALEYMNHPEACKLLENLAGGDPDLRFTQEAAAALVRRQRKAP